MRKMTIKKNLWAMLSLVIMGCALSACSDDDEPSVLETVTPDAASYQLNKAGEATLQFTVSPADASVDNVTLAAGADVFEITGKNSVGNGKWAVSLKAIDLAKVGETNAVSLQVAQTGGAWKEISFSIDDPYSIEGKFALDHPRAFNYYGIEEGHTYDTGLPVVITAEKGGDLTTISNIKIINGETSQKAGMEYFATVKLADGLTGVEIKVNPEKLEDLKNLVPTYTTFNFIAVLTSNSGRVAKLPLNGMTCAPEGTPVVDNQLTVTEAEIINPDFSKAVTLDVTSKLRHIGVMGMQPGDGNVVIDNIGLFNEAGEKVQQESFLVLVGPDATGNMISDFTIMGDNDYRLKPGTYTYVQRFHVDFIYDNGVKYQTVCADLKYQIEIK